MKTQVNYSGTAKILKKEFLIMVALYLAFAFYFFILTERILFTLVASLMGLTLLPYFRKRRIKNLRRQVNYEFQDFLDTLSSQIATGKSIENALVKARNDLQTIHGEESALAGELTRIVGNYGLGQKIEEGFINLGDQYKNDLIGALGEMLLLARQKGGQLVAILKRTGEVLGEQLEVEREIEVLLAKQALEVKVLRVMPFILVLLLKMLYPEMIDFLVDSPIGLGIFFLVSVLIGIAFYYSSKLMEVEWS